MAPVHKLPRPGLIPWEPKISKWPWWAIALVLTGLVFTYLILASKNYQETFVFLTRGIYTTLRITFFSYILATAIGLFTGLARVSKNVFLYNASTFYVEVVRGVPLVVLMLYVAFALVPVLVEVVKIIGDWGLGLAPGSGF
ncbi:MAG: ABC transporter permease subunit, partial [Anaerolineales bacterium]|nr:ABC transporter permease subunit [Anaerolineales bacterium]